MKPPRFHRRDQACGGCGFPLHVAEAADNLSPMMVGELQAEFEASDACADGEDVDSADIASAGRWSHIHAAPSPPCAIV